MDTVTQPTISREETIAQLKSMIEYQELQTKLQELITKQVLEKYNEVKITKMFEQEFMPPKDQPTSADIEQMQTEAKEALATQEPS